MSVWNIGFQSEDAEEPEIVGQLEFNEDNEVSLNTEDPELEKYLQEVSTKIKLLPVDNPKFEKDTIQKLQKVSGLIFEVDEGDEEESVENEQTEQQKVVRPKPIMKVRRV